MNSPKPTTRLTDAGRRHIDRYTRQKRAEFEKIDPLLSLSIRIARFFEGLNRRMWYAMFDLCFHNQPPTRKIPISEVRSVFVIPFGDAIGDMIVALPVFSTIKRHNHSCRVGTIVSHRNLSLVERDPNVDKLYHLRNKNDIRHYPEIFRARKDGYDIVIDMQSQRMTESGIIANLISPSGIKVGVTHKRKSLYQKLFNVMVPYDRKSLHLAQLGLVMLESAIEFERPLEQWESHPRAVFPAALEADVQTRLGLVLQKLGASWFIYCNPQARNPNREWGYNNAIAFARKFTETYRDGAVLFTASPVHRNEVQQNIRLACLPRTAFFETSYDLKELAIVASRARLIITPDTSAIHFGTTSGNPTLVLWPNRDDLPMDWLPFQVPSINLAPEVCGWLVPTISPDEVWIAAKKLLDGEWKHTSTSIGQDPESDCLYQAENCHSSLRELLSRSHIAKLHEVEIAKEKLPV